ncbi:MAG: response regulator [Bacteroidota bacterium]
MMTIRTVLIIEDEANFVQTLEYALRNAPEHRYAVQHAPSAEEGAEIVAHGGRFDVILLDYYLPGRNGGEFLKTLRESGNETPVICISVSQDYKIVQQLLQSGADDYVAKEELNNTLALEKTISAVIEKKLYERRIAELEIGSHRMDAILTIVRTVQHELNNPMAISQLALSRLAEPERLSREEYRRAFDQVQEGIDRMASVLRLLPEVREEVFNEKLHGLKIYSMPAKPPSP